MTTLAMDYAVHDFSQLPSTWLSEDGKAQAFNPENVAAGNWELLGVMGTIGRDYHIQMRPSSESYFSPLLLPKQPSEGPFYIQSPQQQVLSDQRGIARVFGLGNCYIVFYPFVINLISLMFLTVV
ncbi:hypothetical protein E4U23_002617, partial [Claviceps purpurea]